MKETIKQILKTILSSVLEFVAVWLFKLLDKNKDGSVSKKEYDEFIGANTKQLLERLK